MSRTVSKTHCAVVQAALLQRVWFNSPPASSGCTKQTLPVMPQQCALFVSSPGAVLASAAHSGSMRRRLISSVSCSLSSACLLAGRHEVKDKSGGHLVQQSEHGRFSWPLSVFGGVGLAKAMATLQLWSLTFVCLSPKDDKNWAFLASPSPGASLCLRSRKKWRALCAAPSIGVFSVPFNSASLFSNSFTGERTVSDNGP